MSLFDPCRVHRVWRIVGMTVAALGRIALSGCTAAVGSGSLGDEDAPGELRTSQVDEVEHIGGARGVEPDGLIARTSLSNELIVDMVRGFTYRGQGFLRVNDEPFPSTVSPNKDVTLWVSRAGYDAFSEISPEESGSRAELPVGTVIVREVLDNGKVDTITVMVKLPTDAFPLGGDFWYAATDPDGTIRSDKNSGSPLAGLLENCGTCHLRRNDDAFVFGAPAG